MIRYANVNEELKEPTRGLKGFCPGCEKPLIAKCGEIRIHHWAHQRKIDCDPWWEQMTQWHIDWQNKFPKEWREKVIRNEESKEYHRADIHTPQGLTIELQRSSLSLEQIETRNNFYEKLIWVVDAKSFKDGILLQDTPNPNSPLLADFDFQVDTDGFALHPIFYKKEDYRKYGPAGCRWYSERDAILKPAFAEQSKYKIFTWPRKREAWINSAVPVFLDYRDDILYWIRKREQLSRPLYYLQIVSKQEFIAKYTA